MDAYAIFRRDRYKICRTVIDDNDNAKTDFVGNLSIEDVIEFFKREFNEPNPKIQRAYKKSESEIYHYHRYFRK